MKTLPHFGKYPYFGNLFMICGMECLEISHFKHYNQPLWRLCSETFRMNLLSLGLSAIFLTLNSRAFDNTQVDFVTSPST